MLLAILAAVSYEFGSSDKLVLALSMAKNLGTKKYGLTEEQWNRVVKKVYKAMEANRIQNPLVKIGFF